MVIGIPREEPGLSPIITGNSRIERDENWTCLSSLVSLLLLMVETVNVEEGPDGKIFVALQRNFDLSQRPMSIFVVNARTSGT